MNNMKYEAINLLAKQNESPVRIGFGYAEFRQFVGIRFVQVFLTNK